jgi:hypothetical protein
MHTVFNAKSLYIGYRLDRRDCSELLHICDSIDFSENLHIMILP